VIGAGFGGISCARKLGGSSAKVVVIDRRNYHLFVPLLYQVATAALSPADIARPIRRMLARYPNIDVMLDEVTGIDLANRRVMLHREPPIAFGRLVIATGSTYSYFGHDDWAKAAPGPKTIEDARTIRTRLLLAFELAEISEDAAERSRLLTTLIVGGGPTGVEMAGAVAELARNSLARDFRHIDPANARILLVEASDRILGGFPESLATYAEKALTRLGVTVMTGKRVEAVERKEVTVSGERIPVGTVIWGAGVQATPVAKWLGVAADRAGRIAVAPDLSVEGLDGIYVIGDGAASAGADGKPLPALAQVAHQQGLHLGKALRANFADGTPLPPFRFRNRGNTAVIGRNAAVFDFGWLRLKGRLGWFLWALVHIYLLTGFEKRFLVATQWLWSYMTYQSGARLITGGETDRTAK
jgi:NADH:ubiquinone reductase (H+-translocating)